MARAPKRKRRERRTAVRARTRARPAGETEPAPRAQPLPRLSRHDIPPALALVALAVVCFIPALSGGFVWDDKSFIVEEPLVRRWSGLWHIWLSPGDLRELHYWPLTYTTFWLEHKLWGLNPAGYHAVNVVLHALNTVLVWRLMRALGAPGGWAVAALFAVHPLHVEPVAWIIGRKDLLAALFYLGAALAWIRFTGTPGRGRYCLALACYAAAMLSKSSAVTLPAALVVWHWWRQGRVSASDWLRLAPLFAVGFCIALAGVWFFTAHWPYASGYSVVERALVAARALCWYAGKLLWPADLAVIYPGWEISAADPAAWLYVAGVAAVAGGLWLARRRTGRGALAGVAFFALALSPTLGFVDHQYMGISLVAERYAYLAGIGWMAVVVGGVACGVRWLSRVQARTATAALAVVLVVFSTLTWRQSGIYRDPLTLHRHILSHHPESALAHRGMGDVLIELERYEEAVESFRGALALEPESVTAYEGLGKALLRLERYEEAVESFRGALALHPERIAAHTELGKALHRLERYEEALESFRSVVASYHRDKRTAFFLRMGAVPRSLGLPVAYDHMGIALFRLGRHEEALESYRAALALEPGSAMTHVRTGWVLARLGRHEEAVESYRDALALEPESVMAHASMGDALVRLERYEEALESFERALSADPSLEPARAGAEYARRRLEDSGR